MPARPILERPHALPSDFTDRLEQSLSAADSERRRRLWFARMRRALPVVLLIGPLIAWRLTLSTPDGVHVAIGALAWITFVLDLGVHIDTSVLTYLGLVELPSIVGVLLTVMLAASLLWTSKDDQ